LLALARIRRELAGWGSVEGGPGRVHRCVRVMGVPKRWYEMSSHRLNPVMETPFLCVEAAKRGRILVVVECQCANI